MAKPGSSKGTETPAPEKAAAKATTKKAAATPVKSAKKATEKAAKPVKAETVADAGADEGSDKGEMVTSGAFDDKFLDQQKKLLLEERAALLGQAESLEGEAASLMEDLDPGDVQFDDESGEGDSLVVERERDLALSTQARQLISDIDAALGRIADATYGYSLVSGKPIPKERLRAIPWATELVEEKVGGLGTRR
jgi:RNA polymerase-binding transcription factor DksA